MLIGRYIEKVKEINFAMIRTSETKNSVLFVQVNDSEVERNLSAEEHRLKSKAYQNAEQKVIVLQRSLKRSINKSRYDIRVENVIEQI